MAASHLERFRKFVAERYPDCTLAQQVSVYVRHWPSAVVPLLIELLTPKDPDERQAEKSDR